MAHGTAAPDPEPRFHSPEPVVTLVNAFSSPFQNAIAAARTCYSAKGIVLAEEIDERERAHGSDPGRLETLPYSDLARSIYQAGHHTVFQHAYFQFAIENVSRQFIWSFLHSHPHYNSEQVSQRYVRVKKGTYAVPSMPEAARSRFHQAVEEQSDLYEKLHERLVPVVESEFYRIFPGRRKVADRYRSTITKRAQEVARYVLPVATFARLHHTVSALTVFRYHRASLGPDAPAEQRLVARKMVDALLDLDPRYGLVLETPLDADRFPEADLPEPPWTTHPVNGGSEPVLRFTAEFDRDLGGRASRLVGYAAGAEETVAQSVRETLGLGATDMTDDEAIHLVLDPSRNRLLGESLNLLPHSKLGRCLAHAVYTFRKKLSHTADSQNQRHRTTPGSRPVLARHVSGDPDYVLPLLAEADRTASRLFEQGMERAWEAIRDVHRLGAPREHALYLLPNAVAIRFTETGDLMNLHHKYAMRLCYNAQEEIWQASVDEVEQIREVHPRIGRYLLPPCGIRDLGRMRPTCPEGVRYCGIKVWRLPLSAYERLL